MRVKHISPSHFSDFPTTDLDRALGRELCEAIGDTFITEKSSLLEQWVTIAKALRVHDLILVDEGALLVTVTPSPPIPTPRLKPSVLSKWWRRGVVPRSWRFTLRK